MNSTPFRDQPAPLQNLAVFDIDNCLSNDEWRLNLIDFTKANPDDRWREYHAACRGDTVGNIAIFNAVVHVLGMFPVFITSRPESVRRFTEDWIKEELSPPGGFWLYMRADGDHRPTIIVKREAVRMLPRKPVVAYDDRKDIVAMYHDHDIDAKVMCIHHKCAMTPPPGVRAVPLQTDRRCPHCSERRAGVTVELVRCGREDCPARVPHEPGESLDTGAEEAREAMPDAPPTRGEGPAPRPASGPAYGRASGDSAIAPGDIPIPASAAPGWRFLLHRHDPAAISLEDCFRVVGRTLHADGSWTIELAKHDPLMYTAYMSTADALAHHIREHARQQGLEVDEEGLDAARKFLEQPVEKRAPDYLEEAAATFRERNKLYGDNYREFGPMAAALFPKGITIKTADDWNRFAVFMWVLTKVSRYAQNIESGGHADSALDLTTYSAMLRELTKE